MKCVVLATLLLGACASSWDRYPHSLYSALRADSPQAIASHQRLLEKLYSDARKADRKPPAGIAAEYAFYSWKVGKPEVVQEALAVECECYPESKKFVELLGRFLPSVPVVPIPKEPERSADDDF